MTRGLIKRLPMVVSVAALFVMSAMTVSAGGLTIKTSTQLLPPNPLPAHVSPTGHGRAQIELQPGIRERLKLEIQDVEVIGDAADPEFCRGFYEIVVVKDGVELPLPAFPGLIATCLVPGDNHGPTFGARNFDAQLKAGQAAIDPRGGMLLVYQVEVVRDPVTLKAMPGLNGEPFQIAERGPVALQGILQ